MHRKLIRIDSSQNGPGYRLEAEQFLAESRERIFEFFSDAFQLEKLTPPWLRFSVVTPRPIQIRAGTVIDYRLQLHGVPIRWQSRITVWEPPARFVDDQTRGPYRRWHHEHVFEEVVGGTVCRDIVDYSVFGGRLIERLFVRGDVMKIFQFRQRMLEELFPSANSASVMHAGA